MNPEAVNDIIGKVLEHLELDGITTSFHLVKTEEGLYNEWTWFDYMIIEDHDEPAVFSIFVESLPGDGINMILSVLDKVCPVGDMSWNLYDMDTKEFATCPCEQDLIKKFIDYYKNEHSLNTECKGD